MEIALLNWDKNTLATSPIFTVVKSVGCTNPIAKNVFTGFPRDVRKRTKRKVRFHTVRHYDIAHGVECGIHMSKDNSLYSRTWNCVLYPEDESQAYAITLLSNGTYPAVGILHDKDVEEDGTPKKPHYHFVTRYKNARSIKAVADELRIAENYLQPCRDFKKSIRYLIHDGCPDKFPYPLEEVLGALKTALASALDDKTEDEQCLAVLELLESVENPIRMTNFIKLCAEKGLYAVVRRGAYLFATALKEHNEEKHS